MTRMMRTLAGSPALALALTLGACGGVELPSGDVVARLDGAELSYAAFETYLQTQLAAGEVPLDARVLSRLFDQYLREELLRLTAVEQGLVDEAASRRAALDALAARELERTVSGAELEAYFVEHQADFEQPERVELQQFLVAERAVADRVRADLAAGVPFAAIVDGLDGESGSGYHETVGRDDLPPEFVDIVFALDAGDTSPVVPTDYGFHVFHVVGRTAAENPSLEEAAPRIRRLLAERRLEERLHEVALEAARSYNLELFAGNLPFAYEGEHAG